MFFEVVRDYKGLIVLDNMDHYVDIRKNIFTLGVSDFVDGALKYAHDLLIILTCRPKINYATPRFQEINLEGITVQNTIELFRLRKADVDGGETSKMIEKVHNLTEGHPLWLNLIATQVATGLGTIDEIISDLGKGGVDDRAKTMLRAIWKGLNKRQELILRSMAELTKPVDAEWLHMCVEKEIKTWNQFRRAFESLQSLSLVMESQDSLLQKEFDLHPIVRNFIKTEFYTRQERVPFLDRVILVVKAVIDKSGSYSFLTPLSMLENCVLKAELELRKDDFTSAIITLVDVGEKLILRGMPGDLFRVGEDILDHYEAKSIDLIDLHEFQELNDLMAHAYAENGRKDDARRHLERYTRIVPDQTAHFIAVCSAKCYIEWVFKNYEEAISWGREGVRIKESSGIDTEFDSSHNLALALRDSGNIDDALPVFLEGFSIEDVLNSDINTLSKRASYYGNIGRCLQFRNRYDEALDCFIKSAFILENDNSSFGILNQGYAALWIGEVLESKKQFNEAYICYCQSGIIWSKRAPIKSQEPKRMLENLIKKEPLLLAQKMTEAGINRSYRRMIENLRS